MTEPALISAQQIAEGWTPCQHCGKPVRRSFIGGVWRHWGQTSLYTCTQPVGHPTP